MKSTPVQARTSAAAAEVQRQAEVRSLGPGAIARTAVDRCRSSECQRPRQAQAQAQAEAVAAEAAAEEAKAAEVKIAVKIAKAAAEAEAAKERRLAFAAQVKIACVWTYRDRSLEKD